MNNRTSYIIITPVRNEVQYIEKTIISVTNQSILPYEWIIVDDGSTDGTSDLLDKYCANFDWIKVVHRKDRGFRASGSGVVEAFYDGYKLIDHNDWKFLVKLDGDLSFSNDYFENCMKEFELNSKLGVAGGTVYKSVDGQLLVDSPGDPAFHVRGATKIYRHDCWDAIKPLVSAPGWDTIDEIKANMLGWPTVTFRHLSVLQHKPTGSADGKMKDHFKNGKANYNTGYHPLFMFLKFIKRFIKKPYSILPVALFCGYLSGYIKRTPRMLDSKIICYLRRQQLRRIIFLPSIYNK